MGSQVIAICKCELKKEILIGGGIYSCVFSLCEYCKDVVEVNLLDDQPKCPQCKDDYTISYYENLLIAESGNKIIDSWNMQGKNDREIIITNGTFCV